MISFHDISKLFNPQQWDIGYLSAERLLQCSLSPVKAASHPKVIPIETSQIKLLVKKI